MLIFIFIFKYKMCWIPADVIDDTNYKSTLAQLDTLYLFPLFPTHTTSDQFEILARQRISALMSTDSNSRQSTPLKRFTPDWGVERERGLKGGGGGRARESSGDRAHKRQDGWGRIGTDRNFQCICWTKSCASRQQDVLAAIPNIFIAEEKPAFWQ